jgi:cytoskeletal protein CcmA (bactofilin family)
MLGNFTGKKPDKEGTSVATSTASSFPPALPTAVPTGTVRPASALRAGERGIQSVIGPDLTVLGNLVSKGEVTIEGEVQGDLHAQLVVVGDKARITGGIVADDVVVRGHVMGSIRGKKVQLQATSHVEGDVYHQSLAIEQGAYFEGKSRRSEDPTAGVTRPEPSAPSVPLPSSS